MSQITTHVLDTTLGKPASNIDVALFQRQDDAWNNISLGTTNSDGRVEKLLDDTRTLPAGTYKLKFETGNYFDATNSDTFYPHIEIVFQIPGDGQHYHVPLLLNPFGYSTYRGS